MIVVDTSVWINLLRDVKSTAVSRLESSKLTRVIVGDLILMEVLQGCKTTREVDHAERALAGFNRESVAGFQIAEQAAHNYRMLRQRGITIRSTIDVMIATYCIERGYELLTEDRDFKPMAQHLGLRLIE